jgi:hypothetical protein
MVMVIWPGIRLDPPSGRSSAVFSHAKTSGDFKA